jgi:hypothetical protein
MGAPQPKSKPQATIKEILAIVEANKINREKDKFLMVGIRGYYLDSLGRVGKNDRGMYDDAVFLITPNEILAYNFNVDASRVRAGKGRGKGKGMAILNAGVYRYKKGKHKTYMAFTQAGPVTVTRDGDNFQDHGYFGINLHRGGVNGTSSLGCNTWPVSQFEDARAFAYSKLEEFKQKDFPYILIDELARRDGRLLVPAEGK